jgi:hypothetical protein
MLIMKKVGRDTFWATFSKTHLVTLIANRTVPQVSSILLVGTYIKAVQLNSNYKQSLR